MQRPLPVTTRGGIAALLLLCAVICFGCGPRAKPKLYIYCNETFWYVIQEEAAFFSQAYDFRVFLIPLRASRTSAVEETVEVNSDHRAPAPWRPREQEPEQTTTTPQPRLSHTINAEIKEQIQRIAQENFGDCFLSDSQRHHEELIRLALAVKEFPVCYLTLTMLVPEGNSLRFRSIKEVLSSDKILGIVDPAVDGLGESSWKVLGKIAGDESAIPRELIKIYERQYDLLEALEQGNIDAALVWDATSLTNFLLIKYADSYNAENKQLLREAARKRDPTILQDILRDMYEDLLETMSFAETVPLTENPDERCVIAVKLVALGTTSRFGYCERFADFIRSRQGADILRRFGFVPE